MSLLFVAYFTEYGEPKTGLSPTIRIRDLSDNSLVITDVAMSEVGDGFYKYSYAASDNAKNYIGRAYGGVSQPAGEKYVPCVSECAGTLQTIQTNTESIITYIDTEIASILEDTGMTIPALIASLNDLSSIEIQNAITGILNIIDGKVDIGKINGVSVDGIGTELDPWGPV